MSKAERKARKRREYNENYKKAKKKRELEKARNNCRVVAVDAPATLPRGFSGELTSLELCLVAPNGNWSVLVPLADVDQPGFCRDGMGFVIYKLEGAARPAADCPTVIGELEAGSHNTNLLASGNLSEAQTTALIGKGFYILRPDIRQWVDSLNDE